MCLSNLGSQSLINDCQYSTLIFQTFPVYYSKVFAHLTPCWRKIINDCIAAGDLSGFDDEKTVIDVLNKLIKCFNLLINITKGENIKRPVLLIALREGRIFMDEFIKTCKYLHGLFSTHQSEVIKMLSLLQKSTRQLQYICAHGKQNRDSTLAQEGPKIKK